MLFHLRQSFFRVPCSLTYLCTVRSVTFLVQFVQTRGSIPLFWSQKPNLKWQPFPQLSSITNHAQAVSSHMNMQQMSYPGIHVIINLVNRKGRELAVGRVLEDAIVDAKLDFVR